VAKEDAYTLRLLVDDEGRAPKGIFCTVLLHCPLSHTLWRRLVKFAPHTVSSGQCFDVLETHSYSPPVNANSICTLHGFSSECGHHPDHPSGDII